MGITLRRNSKPVKGNPFYGYDSETGYFGAHKSANMEDVRTVYTDGDPEVEAQKLFDQLVQGAEIITLIEGIMWRANLSDGTVIVLRIRHPDDTYAPAVELNVRNSADPAGIKSRKIHFDKKEKI